jgi:dephospho-CoA kinase
VLADDGQLDRGALRRLVFSRPNELEQLNAIVHPEVERMRDRLVREARERGDRVVVCDIPLLFEKNLGDRFDRVILVDAPRQLRLERLVRDRGLGEREAEEMIAAQMPSEVKRSRADIVIDNDRTVAELRRDVDAAWEALSRVKGSG